MSRSIHVTKIKAPGSHRKAPDGCPHSYWQPVDGGVKCWDCGRFSGYYTATCGQALVASTRDVVYAVCQLDAGHDGRHQDSYDEDRVQEVWERASDEGCEDPSGIYVVMLAGFHAKTMEDVHREVCRVHAAGVDRVPWDEINHQLRLAFDRAPGVFRPSFYSGVAFPVIDVCKVTGAHNGVETLKKISRSPAG